MPNLNKYKRLEVNNLITFDLSVYVSYNVLVIELV